MKIEVGQIYSELDDKFVITCIDTYQSNQVGYGTLGIHKLYNDGRVDFESYSINNDDESITYIHQDNLIKTFDSWQDAIFSPQFMYKEEITKKDLTLEDLSTMLSKDEVIMITISSNKMQFYIRSIIEKNKNEYKETYTIKIENPEKITVSKGDIMDMFYHKLKNFNNKNGYFEFKLDDDSEIETNIEIAKCTIKYERQKYEKIYN